MQILKTIQFLSVSPISLHVNKNMLQIPFIFNQPIHTKGKPSFAHVSVHPKCSHQALAYGI